VKKLVVLVSLLMACDSAERHDAEGVANAVLRFRRADLPGTPEAVDALKATPCTAQAACATKDTCLVAGDQIAQALRLKGEVEKILPRLENGTLAKDSLEAQTLPSRLDQADVSLKKGFAALPACDESVAALKRRYRL
jgi:hypothetical protein